MLLLKKIIWQKQLDNYCTTNLSNQKLTDSQFIVHEKCRHSINNGFAFKKYPRGHLGSM